MSVLPSTWNWSSFLSAFPDLTMTNLPIDPKFSPNMTRGMQISQKNVKGPRSEI